MSGKNKTSAGFGARVKESFRKFLVALKRNPQSIPLVMLLLSFLKTLPCKSIVINFFILTPSFFILFRYQLNVWFSKG